jgi:serine/threonine-protein kinase
MKKDAKKLKQLGRYKLIEEIGRGGMAVVYKAYDTSLNREVAIKLLHPHLISHREARERFKREAHSIANLSHPSIVEVYDYAETKDDDVFIVMALIEGITLREFLKNQKNSPMLSEGAALIAREILMALAVAHSKGIVHRDVKPENILIGKNGNLLLSDFGIAYLSGIGQMTVTGQILGSPTYMSPEHIEGSSVDARTDIFSVGILLYEMTVGTLPFNGNTPHQIIKRVVEGYYDHPLGCNPSIGHGVASVIVKCLQSRPELRYQTAKEAADQLDLLLKEAEINTPEKELKEFFDNPDKWNDKIKKRIIPKSLQLGKAAQKAGKYPEAMDHFNRILALDPQNENALAAVNTLSKRRQLRRAMERFGVLIAIILTIGAVTFGILYSGNSISPDDTETEPAAEPDLNSKNQSPKQQPAISPLNSLPKATAPQIVIIEKDSETAAPLKSEPTEILKTKKVKKIKKQPHPKTKAIQTRTVIFNPFPMRVKITIDNEEKFDYKTTDRSRDLTLGKHKVTFLPADKRVLPLTKEFSVQAGDRPMTIGARLKWKPGQLLIRSNVNGFVSVQGRSTGQTNSKFSVPIQNGPTEKLKIIISAPDYLPVTQLVTITAGTTTSLVIPLQKE